MDNKARWLYWHDDEGCYKPEKPHPEEWPLYALNTYTGIIVKRWNNESWQTYIPERYGAIPYIQLLLFGLPLRDYPTSTIPANE